MDAEDGHDLFGDGAGGNILNAARAQTLRYSNFLLTISTNVRPRTTDERDHLVVWLVNNLDELLGSWELMNGNMLKPPGTDNRSKIGFPADNKIISIRSTISIEQGDYQQGQIHAHVVLEVAHEYLNQEDGAEGIGNDTGKPNLGVHINVYALREWLNERIPELGIADERKPEKIYVNSRLLTKGTDNSNKFLTMQYINKDRAKDNGGGVRNLRQDEARAEPALQAARHSLLNGGLEEGPRQTEVTVNEQLYEPQPVAPTFRVQGQVPPQMKYTTVPAPKFVPMTRMGGPKKF